MIIGGLIGGTLNLFANWNNADNFWQGLGYFGVGAAAGVASAAIGGAGIGIVEAATFGGAASGALIGGGNVAMQGGGFGDIAFGAMGGALIGGATGFIGGSISMGIQGIPAKGHWGQGTIPVGDGSGKAVPWPNVGDVLNSKKGFAGKVFNNLLSEKAAGIGGGLGGVGAGNLFQFASYQSSPVNLLTSTDPIGDIFQRVHYLNSVGNGLKDRDLADIILQNGYGKNTYMGPLYHEHINHNRHVFSLSVGVVSPYNQDQYRYKVFDAGFGYLDRFGNYPFNPEYNEGYHSGYFILGYEENYLIRIGAKSKSYHYLKRLFKRYRR